MNNWSVELTQKLKPKNLLNHPFYKAWSDGCLTKQDLKIYAEQYFHHVLHFPRAISAIHSQCEDLKARKVLLENLVEEEKGKMDHPSLWVLFAKSLGCQDEDLWGAELLPETKKLCYDFVKIAQRSYASGLGALFSYEEQVPEISISKRKGLEEFYGIQSDDATAFFRVHEFADVRHAKVLAELMDSLPTEGRLEAEKAAFEVRELLWGFLDGMMVRLLGPDYAIAS